MKQYQKISAGGKSLAGVIRNIPVNIAVNEILDDTAAGVKRVRDEVGLAIMRVIMEGERQRLLGEKVLMPFLICTVSAIC